MKRLWIVLAIIAGILAISLWGLWHLNKVTDQMESTLEQISAAVEKEEGDQVKVLTAEFQLEWHQQEEILVRYIHHESLDAITSAVARLPALARYEQYPELASEVERVQELLNHVREAEFPTWKNIC